MVDNRCNLHRVLTLEMMNMQMLHGEPGAAARRHGRAASAVGYCERAIAANPMLTPARRNLALVHASNGRLDLAWEELQRADAHGTASYNLGIINLARREPSEALTAFTTACRENSIAGCRRAASLRLDLGRQKGEQ